MKPNDKPIIFITHSLGGIILKEVRKAIEQMNETHDVTGPHPNGQRKRRKRHD